MMIVTNDPVEAELARMRGGRVTDLTGCAGDRVYLGSTGIHVHLDDDQVEEMHEAFRVTLSSHLWAIGWDADELCLCPVVEVT